MTTKLTDSADVKEVVNAEDGNVTGVTKEGIDMTKEGIDMTIEGTDMTTDMTKEKTDVTKDRIDVNKERTDAADVKGGVSSTAAQEGFDAFESSKVRRTRISTRTNLLEMEAVNYEVQEIEKPNLYREFFEYVEVPKVGFNFRTSPYDMPEEILITDSTFRDGQQSREPYTTRQIIR